jgi:hypothetical protein
VLLRMAEREQPCFYGRAFLFFCPRLVFMFCGEKG